MNSPLVRAEVVFSAGGAALTRAAGCCTTLLPPWGRGPQPWTQAQPITVKYVLGPGPRGSLPLGEVAESVWNLEPSAARYGTGDEGGPPSFWPGLDFSRLRSRSAAGYSGSGSWLEFEFRIQARWAGLLGERGGVVWRGLAWRGTICACMGLWERPSGSQPSRARYPSLQLVRGLLVPSSLLTGNTQFCAFGGRWYKTGISGKDSAVRGPPTRVAFPPLLRVRVGPSLVGDPIIVAVTVSWGCHSKGHKLGGLQTQTFVISRSWGLESEIQVWQGQLPLKTPGEGPSSLLQLLGAPDVPGLWLHRSILASVSTWSSPCVSVSQISLFL